MEPTDHAQVVAALRRRSLRIRLFAQFLILVILLVAGLTMIFFFTSSQYVPNTEAGRKLSVKVLGLEINSEDMYRGEQIPAAPSSALATESNALRAELALLKTQAAQTNMTVNTLGSAILRIGSVLLAIYVIQVLVHITRYNFRVADHLDSLADLLLMTRGETASMNALSTLFSTRHISFGGAPASASDSVASLVGKAIDKLPGKKSDA